MFGLNFQALVFMGFSIVSVVLAGIMIGFYSGLTIAWYAYYIDEDYKKHGSRNSEYDAVVALSVIILILGVVEFIIGIWAAVSVCYYYQPSQQVSSLDKSDNMDENYSGRGGWVGVLSFWDLRVNFEDI